MLRQGSRSFATAAYFLPRVVREPATALYAFCRAADDVVDQAFGVDQAWDGVAVLQERLALIYAGRPLALPEDRAFARVVETFAMPRALPDALLEGFAWDVAGRRYPDLSALRSYAVRVAGTVGAMMAVLMGVRDASRLARAVDLGVAMQLFNIARDVGEDARAGRLYLPTEWLREAGIDPDAFLAAPRFTPALGLVIHRLLGAATEHARTAQAGIARLPVGCRIGIGAASALYAEIGAEVARRGFDSVSSRAVVSAPRKLLVLTQSLLAQARNVPARNAVVLAEGEWLVQAALQVSPRTTSREAWWHIPKRIGTFIDLLERLEQRERVGM
jgi:phytoene synthase